MSHPSIDALYDTARDRIATLRDLTYERLVAAEKLANAEKVQKQLRSQRIAAGVPGKNEAERRAHLDTLLAEDEQHSEAERIVEEQTLALSRSEIETDFHNRMLSLELATLRALGGTS